jgi:hypothetical protein
MSNTTLTSIIVSGTNFDVPRDLFLHLKSLPWCAQTGGGSSVAIEADPDAFRWLLHYIRHKSLPDSFWEDEDMESLHTLAVVLGMHELVQFLLCERRAERHLPEHCSGEKRLLSTWQSVRGSRKKRSWQNRKAAQGAKRKLDALAASFLRGSVVRKRAKSYEELVHPSDCVK